jgi:hypothetical protein
MPTGPSPPILLIVTAATAFISSLVYLVGMIARGTTHEWDTIWRRRPTLTQSTLAPPISSTNLVTPPLPHDTENVCLPLSPPTNRGEHRRLRRPNLAFLGLSTIALAVSLAGTAIQLIIVHDVRKEWDQAEALAVSLQMSLGPSVYCESSSPLRRSVWS